MGWLAYRRQEKGYPRLQTTSQQQVSASLENLSLSASAPAFVSSPTGYRQRLPSDCRDLEGKILLFDVLEAPPGRQSSGNISRIAELYGHGLNAV
jgi:hypothetical protein